MRPIALRTALRAARRTGLGLVGVAVLGASAAAQIGTNYCTPNPNSTGGPSHISATGSTDVTANDVTLACASLPTSSFGFFIVSRNQGFVANPAGSAGNLCLSGALGRYSLSILNSGANGQVSLQIDLQNVPHPVMPFSVNAGDTLNFQYWHRDSSMSGPTSNFSEGLEVTFTTAPPTPSWQNDVWPLLDTINAAGVACTTCHGGTCGLDLSTSATAYAALVNVSPMCCFGGDPYVAPGNAAGSLIYQKLTNPQCGSGMPLVGTFPGDTNVVRDWINAGAPNN